MKNKFKNLNKNFKIIYTICFIILTLIFIINIIRINNIKLEIILFLINIILFIILFFTYILCLILGIKNITNNIETKNTIKKSLLILFFFFIFIISVPVITKKISIKKNSNEINSITKNLINGIKSETQNKYIYTYDDLIKYDKSMENYSKDSYVINNDNEINICISNNKYKLKGKENVLKLSKANGSNKNCKFKFTFEQDKNSGYTSIGAKYLKNYLANKYNISIIDVKTNVDCSLFNCSIIDYSIITKQETFTAYIEIKNNKIVVTDNHK